MTSVKYPTLVLYLLLGLEIEFFTSKISPSALYPHAKSNSRAIK